MAAPLMPAAMTPLGGESEELGSIGLGRWRRPEGRAQAWAGMRVWGSHRPHLARQERACRAGLEGADTTDSRTHRRRARAGLALATQANSVPERSRLGVASGRRASGERREPPRPKPPHPQPDRGQRGAADASGWDERRGTAANGERVGVTLGWCARATARVALSDYVATLSAARILAWPEHNAA